MKTISIKLSLTLFLLFSLMSSLAKAKCSLGCLKCLDDDPSKSTCLLCDLLSNFSLTSNGLCEEKKISGCAVLNFKADSIGCMQCQQNMMFDSETGSCISVPSEKIIENCSYYKNDGSCAECQTGFKAENGLCVDLGENLIQKCISYSDNTCLYCEGGYRFDGEKCVSFSGDIAGCGIYTDIECTQCENSFQVDYMKLIGSRASSISDDFVLKITKIDFKKNYFNRNFGDFCYSQKHSNCLESVNSVECKTCLSGYFPASSSRCDLNPKDAILECKKYSDLTTCMECNLGFYLNSNKCKKSTVVDNCSKYHSTLDQCLECSNPDNLHFISQGICSLRVSSKDKCDSYNPSADQCLSCDVSKFYFASNLCEQRTVIDSCAEYSETEDKCSKCQASHRVTDDKLKCLPKIDFCKTYQSSNESLSAFVCDACESTHYTTDNSVCLAKSVADCKTLKSGNVNECETCDGKFYLDSETKNCSAQSVDKCSQYTPNTNNCVKCDDLFYINGKICSPVDASLNCLHSDGINNTCVSCAGSRFLNKGSCNDRVNPQDPKCEMNDNSADDTSCTKCGSNDTAAVLGLVPLSPEKMAEMFCLKLDPATGLCIQCAEGAESKSPGVCTESSNTSSVCLQLKENIVADLDSNETFCAKCRNEDEYYLNSSDVCIKRVNFTTANCKILSKTEDKCLGYTPEMTVYRQNYISFCKARPDNTQSIIGCIYFDPEDVTKCLYCSPGFKMNEAGNACEPSNIMVYPKIIDIGNYEPVQITENSPGYIQNCSSFYYHSIENKFYCSSCQMDFKPMIDLNHSSYPVLNSLGSPDRIIAEFPIIACESTLKPYKDGEGLDIMPKKSCEYYAYNSEDDSHECVQCQNMVKTTFVTASFKSDGTTQIAKTVIESCDYYDGFMNGGFGLQYEGELELLHVNLLPKVGCFNLRSQTDELVLLYPSTTLPNRTIEIPDKTGIIGDKYFKCLSGVTNASVPNCGAHWSPGVDHSTVISPYVAQKCLACKTGYKAIFDPVTKEITQCEEIANCDLTKSSMYNGCSNCKTGFRTTFDPVSFKFNSSECISESTLTHLEGCSMVGKTKCFACIPGLIFDENNNCVQNPNQESTNCAREGMNSLSFTIPESRPEYDQFLASFKSITMSFPGCSECSEGYLNVIHTDPSLINITPAFPGTEKYKKIALQPIPNCKTRKEFTSEKCAECEPQFILNEFDYTCVDPATVSQSHPNCKTLTNLDSQLVCASCLEGFSLNPQSNKCDLAHNCELYITIDIKNVPTRVCSLSKVNFKTQKDPSPVCTPITDENEICSQFVMDGSCVKCKEQGKIPVNHLNTYDKSPKVEYKCITQSTQNIPKFDEKKYYLQLIYRSDNLMEPMLVMLNVDHEGITHNYTSEVEYGQYPFKSTCFTFEKDVNCEVSFANKCFSCKEYHYMDLVSGKCTQGSLTGCIIYKDSAKCIRCDENHWMNESEQCIRRNAQNCSEMEDATDECKTCVPGHYLEIVKGSCKENLSNCNKCIKYTKDAGCKSMEENQDLCKECNDDHYFSSSKVLCIQRLNLNCSSSKKNEDKCEACQQDFYFMADEGKCVSPTPVENCAKYNALINKCSECNEKYFLDSSENTCVMNPDGIPGCENYSSRTKCEMCRDEMYLSDNKCVRSEVTVDGCGKYESDGVCLSCLSSHLMVQNECQLKNNNTCAEWKDVDNCESCPSLKVLKTVSEKLQCVSISIPNCVSATMKEDKMNCLKCKDGLLPSDDKLSCVTPTTAITDCQVYLQSSSKENPKCERCIDRRVLNVTKDKCSSQPQITTGSCVHGKELVENKCMHCSAGKRFDGEGCVSCGGEGCLSCDITDPEKCFVCLPKYTMHVSGVCKVTFEETRGMTSLWNIMYVGLISALFLFSKDQI